MDKKQSILNVSVSVALKLLLLLAGIAVRRMVIAHLGSGVNGLNSLFLSMIDVLSLAELGVGEAMTYGMYEPAAKGNREKLAALYRQFRRYYRIIGAVMFCVGLLLVPVLPLLAPDYEGMDSDLGTGFLLMLLSACMTYGFGAESALLNAHKNNYITAAVTGGGKLLQYALQMAVLTGTGDYQAFLICRVISAGVQWTATRYLARKFYSPVLECPALLDRENKKQLGKSIRAMFFHRLGKVAVSSTDSILISAFTGVVMLGKYSNYTTVLTAMTSLLGLAFSSLTSTVGHLYVRSSRQTLRRHFEAFHGLNHMLGAVFFLGYYAVIDPLAALLFGGGLALPRHVTLVLTMTQYLHFTRRAVLLFRDATGTFYHDRWKPLVESAVNLAVSVALGRMWGILGVLLGTVVTDLLICDTVEPWALYRHVFGRSPAKFCLKNYGYILLFALGLWLLELLLPEGAGLLRSGCLSLAVSGLLCLVILTTEPALRDKLYNRRENHGTK